ncbi:hypothetical protein GW17_00018112 [Ensete ventricosum]|nr:hypothetical protein GW17_00018112 [Ensete ventricosum]RZS00271.1 hypothetical protein BHM03_00029945 [Ensete ventricosum]
MAFYSHPTKGGEGTGPFEVEKSTQLITFSLRWKQWVYRKRPTTPLRGQNFGPGSRCSDNLARRLVEEKVVRAGERRPLKRRKRSDATVVVATSNFHSLALLHARDYRNSMHELRHKLWTLPVSDSNLLRPV